MTDVFLSYANEDQQRAGKLARALEDRGWSVWWDRKIIAGQSFDLIIERELETAKNIVVLWSEESIASEWVKNEASVGAERGVLVPALIDRVKLPLEFRRRQTADLVDWDGSSAHDGFQALCNALVAKRPAVAVPVPHPTARPESKNRLRHSWVWSVIATIAAALGVVAYWGFTTTEEPTLEQARERPILEGATEQQIPMETGERAGPADAIAGTYYGDVQSDARGSSQSDVTVSIAKLSNRRVRVTSDYDRLGIVEVDVSRVGDSIQSVRSEALLLLELHKDPPSLHYNPDGSVAYYGEKQ